uniref:Uncharacterized protein n=1 Tax=Chromera velia CCMP2878 TaxID=1169474 RepID=A0A0G4IDA8_9ALVE|eukprot:Cvel_13353.t1-p1 / transcript=Cvel_13353.t1 / gene=Cvel_13353 / organism=Chromera_velia_CCMP2878 / gene_product=Protein TANC1, putative / transcript_product=Protein TANC1, putative / location=Cvel_scaffold907:14979-19810(+) / protein_length=369 / sequence_SO=supercontig / SO=protein_coding / is_pseudo=false
MMKTRQDLGSLLHDVVERNDIEAVKLLQGLGASLEEKQKILELPLSLSGFEGAGGRKVTVPGTPLPSSEPLSKGGWKFCSSSWKRLGKRGQGSTSLLRTFCSSINAAIVVLFNVEGQTASAVFLAAWNGHTSTVQFLVEHHEAPINGAEQDINTPLFVAASRGHLETVRFLVDKKASLRPRGRSPLFVAAENGHVQTVEFLFQKGVPLDERKRNGQHTIFAATENGHFETVKFLADNGADLNVLNQHGETPLFVAARKGHLMIVKLLEEKGANTNIRNSNGRTPWDVAKSFKHQEVFLYLIGGGSGRPRATLLNSAQSDGTRPISTRIKRFAPDVCVEPTQARTQPQLATRASSVVWSFVNGMNLNYVD